MDKIDRKKCRENGVPKTLDDGFSEIHDKLDEIVGWINAHEERELGHNVRTVTKPDSGE